jgi:hypothetical protein
MAGLIVAIIVLALGGLPGCGAFAYLRAENARNVTLIQQLDGYVIPKPVDEVWPKVILVHGPHDNLDWSGLG